MLKTLCRGVSCGVLLVCGSGAAMAQTATTFPATIQAEDFDQGSAGVAYSDTTGGNTGGEYRGTDVDIEATADAGGGYNVGWTAPGEWLRYTVTVPTAGTYDLEFRVASRLGGGIFHLEVNGVDRTGPLTMPMTGDWQTWTTVRRTGVTLSAGQQVWRLVFDTRGQTNSVGNINYFRVTGPVGAAPSSTPYTGTPVALPGTLQAENYDNGGEGVAYHDLSTGNDGGQYRTTAVDVTSTSDSGGGYILGWIAAGEWLNYTVNVGAPGTYDVEVRVASNGTGGTFHIEVNGTDRTGPFSVPNTGGWQTWVTVRKTGLTLSAGTQMWRLVMDSAGSSTSAVGNINYVRVVASQSGGGSTPFTGAPPVLPGVVQAEAYDNGGEGLAYHDLSSSNEGGEYRQTGVDIEGTSDTGGGFNVGWIRAGEWLGYTVDVPTAGTYDVETRVASSGSGGRFHIEVDGVDRTGPFTVPDTGGWQGWVTLRKTGLSLSAGRQVWRIVMDANGATGSVGNLNYFRVVAAGGSPNQAPTTSLTNPANGATFTAPPSISLAATAADSDGTIMRVDFYRGSTLIGSDTTSPYSVTWNNPAAGSYALTAVAFDNGGASTTSSTVNVTVNGTSTPLPTRVVFTASPDHATGVTSYVVALYRATDPVTATPVASTDIGKPAPSNNEITVDISVIVNPLASGSYYAVVTARGPGGSGASTPSPTFTK